MLHPARWCYPPGVGGFLRALVLPRSSAYSTGSWCMCCPRVLVLPPGHPPPSIGSTVTHKRCGLSTLTVSIGPWCCCWPPGVVATVIPGGWWFSPGAGACPRGVYSDVHAVHSRLLCRCLPPGAALTPGRWC